MTDRPLQFSAAWMSQTADGPPPLSGHAGFSLIEAIIATGLLATLVVGIGHVFLVSSRAIHIARVRTLAAILAGQKMEQLRSLSWAHEPGGALLSDVSTNLAAEPPSAGWAWTELRASGVTRCRCADVRGLCECQRGQGAHLGVGRIRQALVGHAARIRPTKLLMLEVRVLTVGGGDARLASIKARRP